MKLCLAMKSITLLFNSIPLLFKDYIPCKEGTGYFQLAGYERGYNQNQLHRSLIRYPKLKKRPKPPTPPPPPPPVRIIVTLIRLQYYLPDPVW